MINMRKKMIITGVIAIVIVGGIAVYVDSLNLKKMGDAAETAWPTKNSYSARLAKINNLKSVLQGSTFASTPDGKDLLSKLSNQESLLGQATNKRDEVATINRIEMDAAKIIIALDSYPELKMSSEIQSDIDAISTRESSAWSKGYDDTTAFYNIAINRKRHLLTSFIFNLRPITPIGNTWEVLRSKKIMQEQRAQK